MLDLRPFRPLIEYGEGRIGGKCLAQMQACQWENQQVGRSIDILGIVSNGNAWAFYKSQSQTVN
jgi:hypothetical protein